jgi:hypothetical protein
MTYEEKCELLGIKRPDSLAKRFGEEMPSVAIGKFPQLSKKVGPRVPDKVSQDFSHLNPARGAECQKHTKEWWGKLSAEERSRRNQLRFSKE